MQQYGIICRAKCEMQCDFPPKPVMEVGPGARQVFSAVLETIQHLTPTWLLLPSRSTTITIWFGDRRLLLFGLLSPLQPGFWPYRTRYQCDRLRPSDSAVCK